MQIARMNRKRGRGTCARSGLARRKRDIEPDDLAMTLTIRIHHMADPVQNKGVAALLDDLTKRAFGHPEIGAKTIYTLA